MHSVLNSWFAAKALNAEFKDAAPIDIFEKLSDPKSVKLQQKVKKYGLANGMTYIEDDSGANINVQIFDSKYFYEPAVEMPEEDMPCDRCNGLCFRGTGVRDHG